MKTFLSQELESFNQKIEREFCQGSAIAPGLYDACISIIEDTGYWEPNRALGHKVATLWQTHKPHSYGAIACFNQEIGNLWQGKPEFPVIEKDGKIQRYAAPKGSGLRAFTPAVTVAEWFQIAEKHHLKGHLPTWVTQAASNNQNELTSNTSQSLTQNEQHCCASQLRKASVIPSIRDSVKATGFTLAVEAGNSLKSPVLQESTKKTTQGTKSKSSEHLKDKKALTPSESFPISDGFSKVEKTTPLGEVKKLSSQFPIETSSFWQWIELLNIPIVITEGGKKALALLSHGYVAIALYGVRCGVLENETINGEKVRRLKPELIPDLQRFATLGRKITIAFDQDDKPKTRADVTAATSRLGFMLGMAGCQVSVAQWKPEQGKGVDDLIVKGGVEAWEKAHSEAVSFAGWSVARQLAHEVRRKPDLNIGDREFIEVAMSLAKTGIIALHGGKGTGKSKAIGLMLQGRRWLSLSHLTSIARDQAAGWGGVFVNDGDRHGSSLLKDGKPVDGGSVCLPSLFKVLAIEAKVLVLDEISALLEFLLSSRLCNKDGIRSLLLAEFSRRIKEADLVLIADADLSEEALEYIEAIRGERAYLVRSERQALTYDAFIIDGKKNEAIAMLLERDRQTPEGKVFYINADSKALTETLAEILGRDKCLIINGDTIGGQAQASLLSSKGHDLPGLILQGTRYVISSPSVVQGFSFEHHTDLIDSFWGFYQGCSISAHAIAQAPDRIRNSDIERFFWIGNRGSAYSKLSKAQGVAAFLKEFKQLNSTAARLVRNSLTPEAQADVDGLDWQSQNLKMLAAIEVRRNRGMVNLRETLIALLKQEGKKVSIIAPPKELPNVSRIVKQASEAVNARYCLAVENAETITKEAAEKLADKTESLTPEQLLSLEKFYMGEFYRLENVKSLDVKFDRKGRTKAEIKALEALLVPGLAEEVTAKTINKNATSPQDWNQIAVKVWLLEQSGAAAAIRRIAAGEITSIDSDTVEEIASFIRAHPKEFRIAFGFRCLDKMSDQQIIGEILSRHGIKTKRIGNKNNLRYEVDKPHLEAMLAIIERRKSAIAPLEDQGLKQRGAIPQNLSPELEKWMAPESLADVRWMWQQANTPELVEELWRFIPPEVLERAIA